MTLPVLKTGQTCYFDGFSGLVTCRVLSIAGESSIGARSSQRVKLRVIRDSRVYSRGAVIDTSALWAVPPGALRRRRYSTRVTVYAVECDAGTAPASPVLFDLTHA